MSSLTRELEQEIYAKMPGVRLGWIGADNTAKGKRYVIDYDGVDQSELLEVVREIVGQNTQIYLFRKDIK